MKLHVTSLGALVALGLPLGLTFPQQKTATIAGVVTAVGSGEPLLGVQVILTGTKLWTLTNVDGLFHLAGLPPGRHIVEVKHPNRAPLAFPVNLSPDQTLEFAVKMETSSVPLPELVVEGEKPPPPAKMTGFYSRRGSGQGHFITRDEIEKRQPRVMTDMLRNVPGLRITCDGGSCRAQSFAETRRFIGGCPIQYFLDVKQQGASFVPALQLSGTNSTHDSGDFALSTKIRLLPESGHRPSFAVRFGFIMPNSNQARGIGTNTTNVFAVMVLGKHFGRLNVFGNAGVEILQAPNAKFSQNDVLVYGLAFSYPIHRRVNLVGEVAGRHSTRTIDVDLIGTESHSQARLGFQILAGGFQWDLAGIAGLYVNDARSGFTFGVSKDIKLFDYDRIR